MLHSRVILQAAAVATGNGTAMDVTGYGSAQVQVVIADTATITFESTIDGKNWVTQEAVNTSGSRVTTATASGIFKINVAGLSKIRARVSAWTGGAVDAVGIAVEAGNIGVVAVSSVTGGAADGAATSGNPVLVAGHDGTNAETLLTDSSGRQVVIGAAADGAAKAGAPVLVAGQDGTNAQSILTDSTGALNVVGAAADGAAKVGAPVLVGGQDGTNAQSLLTDAAGRLAHPYKTTTALLAETIVTSDATTSATAVAGFGGHDQLTVLLTIAGKTMDASTTLDIYIQTSPDDGTTWDDIISFSQVTTGAIGNGTYVATVVNATDAGFVDRATRAQTLTANNIADYFCDQLRVTYVSTNFSGGDTITITVSAVAQ